LIGGGALGNVIDRAELGYVTDFVRVPPIWLFQVFNVADASICVGAVLLALALWLGERKPKPKEERAAAVESSPSRGEGQPPQTGVDRPS
jgi:signal peptidase II